MFLLRVELDNLLYLADIHEHMLCVEFDYRLAMFGPVDRLITLFCGNIPCYYFLKCERLALKYSLKKRGRWAYTARTFGILYEHHATNILIYRVRHHIQFLGIE